MLLFKGGAMDETQARPVAAQEVSAIAAAADDGTKTDGKENGELKEYRDFVAKVAEAADGKTILNRSAQHAAVIVEFLFRKAEREMKIATGELHPIVYGVPGVIEAALSFLRKNASAHIEIKSERSIDRATHPLLSAIDAAGYADRVTITVANERFPFHFALADGKHFRFERTPPGYEAVVQFGGAKFGSRLAEFYPLLAA